MRLWLPTPVQKLSSQTVSERSFIKGPGAHATRERARGDPVELSRLAGIAGCGEGVDGLLVCREIRLPSSSRRGWRGLRLVDPELRSFGRGFPDDGLGPENRG